MVNACGDSAVTLFCRAKLGGFKSRLNLGDDGLMEVSVRFSGRRYEHLQRDRLARWRVKYAGRRR